MDANVQAAGPVLLCWTITVFIVCAGLLLGYALIQIFNSLHPTNLFEARSKRRAYRKAHRNLFS